MGDKVLKDKLTNIGKKRPVAFTVNIVNIGLARVDNYTSSVTLQIMSLTHSR
jgi:hypothetical protein